MISWKLRDSLRVSKTRFEQKFLIFFVLGSMSYGCPDLCSESSCSPNQECIQRFENNSTKCQCKNTFTQHGENCDNDINVDSEVSFHDLERAFIKFQNSEIPLNPLNSSVVFSFRTDQRRGLLFYAHDQFDNFIQIHLSNEYQVVLTLNYNTTVKNCVITAKDSKGMLLIFLVKMY